MNNELQLLENAPFGYSYSKIILDNKGTPVDYKFIKVNEAFEKIVGCKPGTLSDHNLKELSPDFSEEDFARIDLCGNIALNGVNKELNHYSKPLKSWYKVQIYSPEKYFFITVFFNTTKTSQQQDFPLNDNQNILNSHNIIYNDIFKSIQDGISVLDSDFKIIYTNDTMKEWYHKNLPFEGKKCYQAYYNNQNTCNPCPALRCLKTGNVEKEIVKGLPDSEVQWLELYCYPITNSATGKVNGVVEFVRDITERKKAENALLESRENIHVTLNSIGEGVISADVDGKVVNMNPVAEKLCGWSLTNARGKKLKEVFNIIHSETGEKIENPVNKVLKIGKIVDLTNDTLLISKDGREYQITNNASPIKNKEGVIIGVVLVFSDITKKYETEKELRKNEERLSYATTIATDGMFDWNLQTNEAYFSPKYYIMLGYEPDEFNANYDNWLKLLHPDDVAHSTEQLQNAIKNNQPFNIEFRAKTKKGEWIWINGQGKIVEYDEKGNPLRVIGTHINIDKRKKAQKDLLKEKHFFQTLINALPDTVYFKDYKHRFLRVNKAKANEQSANPDYMIGKTDFDFFEKDFAQKCADDDEYVYKTKKPIINKEEDEIIQDSKSKFFLSSKFPLKDIEGNIIGTMGISRDITKQKQAEKNLIKINKKLKNQNKIFLDLMHNGSWYKGDLKKTAAEITEASAKVLNCERVSVWWYNENYTTLECFNLYERSKKKHSKGEKLKCSSFPEYIEHHKKGVVVSANDVTKNQIAKTIPGSYYKKHNIKSLMDAPISIKERLGGVISFENVGKIRSWTLEDEQFATSMTTLISLCYETSENTKAQKALQTSEKQYRTLLEKAFDGIYMLYGKKIEYVNQQFCKLTEYSQEELTSKDFSFDNLLTEDAKNIIKQRYYNIKEGSKLSNVYTYQIITKSGKIKDVETSITYLRKGETPRTLGIIRDITEQVKAEKLEMEIKVARKSAEFKQKFMANMSHEIRTPLTGILGLADILAETNLNEKQKAYVDTLVKSGESLKEIINLILDYSKIESGKVSLKYIGFPANTIFDEVIGMFSSITHNKNIKLKTSISPEIPKYIKTDKFRVNQILTNLLSNAIKFTEKGNIKFRAKLESPKKNLKELENDEMVVIKVEVNDTGIGITPQAKKLLFKPFSQIDEKEVKNIEGTGLGLSICKELTEMLGGKIGVTSTPGKGSTFWFTFKAQIINQKDIQSISINEIQQTKGSVSLNILLVEDVKVNQMVISLILNSMGHKVDAVNNGKEALEKFKPGIYDIILMDIQMPVMDGITATKKLKKKYSDLPPIIGLSAYAFEGDREKYMIKGMDEYLVKPIKNKDFENVLNKLGVYKDKK